MTIIRKGSFEKKYKIYAFTCGVCDCEFQCEEHEITMASDSHNESYYIYDCPTCGEKVYGSVLGWRKMEVAAK